jgi:uncharacterized protein YndB with AHSA1/START domain
MATSKDRVEISKLLDAPRELVWEAWSRVEHLVKWFAPDGFVCHASMDFRVGGSLSIRLVGMGFDNTVSGSYLEIVPNERIVWGMRFTDVPEHEMRTTVTLAARGEQTEIRVEQVFPSWSSMTPAQRELIAPRMAGAPVGWSQTLQHLADFVRR